MTSFPATPSTQAPTPTPTPTPSPRMAEATPGPRFPNEGTWPPALAADPWMSRPMRTDFGLPLESELTEVLGAEDVRLHEAHHLLVRGPHVPHDARDHVIRREARLIGHVADGGDVLLGCRLDHADEFINNARANWYCHIYANTDAFTSER